MLGVYVWAKGCNRVGCSVCRGRVVIGSNVRCVCDGGDGCDRVRCFSV